MLCIKIITAYPEMFPGALAFSLIGKALKQKKFSLETINLHDFGIDERNAIDDEPFGGGPGMIIRPDVVERALLSINSNHKLGKCIYGNQWRLCAMLGAPLITIEQTLASLRVCNLHDWLI